jgi:hypothetical protein
VVDGEEGGRIRGMWNVEVDGREGSTAVRRPRQGERDR